MTSTLSEQFLTKDVHIVLTNWCDAKCGGCTQYCPNIPDDRYFFLTLEELKWSIDVLKPWRSKISIFGGEPVMHPEWAAVLEMLYEYEEIEFLVFTKYESPRTKNVKYRPDFKDPETSSREFYPSLIAPIDIFPEKDKSYYSNVALAKCHGWLRCPAALYKNKLYFCERAGAIDLMFGGNFGWVIEKDTNPFIRTDQEIIDQAKQCCFRCGSFFTCMDEGRIYSKTRNRALYPRQFISSESLLSPTNAKDLSEKKYVRDIPKIYL